MVQIFEENFYIAKIQSIRYVGSFLFNKISISLPAHCQLLRIFFLSKRRGKKPFSSMNLTNKLSNSLVCKGYILEFLYFNSCSVASLST